MIKDKMVAWHHRLNRHMFEQAPGESNGQESLACCPKIRIWLSNWTTKTATIIMLSSHSLVRTTHPMMLLTQHEDLGWLHLGRNHRAQIQLPSLNTQETGARHWVGLQATMFHFPLSTLMSFNSWPSMTNRKNREVGRNSLKGLSSYNVLTTCKSFSLICKTFLWDTGTSIMSPLKNEWGGKKQVTSKKRKKNKTDPQTKLLSGGRWKVWWFWNEPHFTI